MTSEQPDLTDVLSGALGREVALAEAQGNGDSSEATAEEYWPDIEGLEHRDTVTEWELPAGTFFDLALVHVLTTATLERLRALYPQGRFEVRRFRPNIVIANDESGFVENDWIDHTLAIGEQVRLRISGPCPRCVMTTLAQGDLPKDPGILRTAAQNNSANVGVYADVLRAGVIRRGRSHHRELRRFQPARLVFSCGWHITLAGKDDYPRLENGESQGLPVWSRSTGSSRPASGATASQVLDLSTLCVRRSRQAIDEVARTLHSRAPSPVQ